MDYFGARVQEGEGGSGIEKRRQGRWRARGVLHDFKLTIIVGCDMYYVSRGSESWADFHGEEGNKSPMSQFERVQLAWAPHLTANYNSSSSKSSPPALRGTSRHPQLIVSLTRCPINRMFLCLHPLRLQWKIRHWWVKLLSCSTLPNVSGNLVFFMLFMQNSVLSVRKVISARLRR